MLFVLGSCLAGAASSIDALIAFRVLQGAAAGLLMPVGETILAQAASSERIGRVTSVVGARRLRPLRDRGRRHGRRAVTRPRGRRPRARRLFVLHARSQGARAPVDVTFFARRGFAAVAATTLCLGIALFGALILLPLYYQLVRGESPRRTGLLLVPQAVGAALAMPIAGRLTEELGAGRVISAGVLLAPARTAVYTQLGPDTPYALLGAALFVIALGLGATVMPSTAVACQSAPRESAA
jgi:MFS family permease